MSVASFKMRNAVDQKDLQELKTIAYLSGLIDCYSCLAVFEFENSPSDPMDEWAILEAKRASKAGWRCVNKDQERVVLCPSC